MAAAATAACCWFAWRRGGEREKEGRFLEREQSGQFLLACDRGSGACIFFSRGMGVGLGCYKKEGDRVYVCARFLKIDWL